MEDVPSLTNCFAVVDWLDEHPLQSVAPQSVAPLGNPFIMMCKDTFTETF